MKKEANLQLEVRRIRTVDLHKISGGMCKATSQYESTIPNSSG